MAAVTTRCKCGCESIINSDVPKQFINNRVCFKCKEPLKFRVKDEPQEVILPNDATDIIKIEDKVSKQRKVIKSKSKKGTKRKQ